MIKLSETFKPVHALFNRAGQALNVVDQRLQTERLLQERHRTAEGARFRQFSRTAGDEDQRNTGTHQSSGKREVNTVKLSRQIDVRYNQHKIVLFQQRNRRIGCHRLDNLKARITKHLNQYFTNDTFILDN